MCLCSISLEKSKQERFFVTEWITSEQNPSMQMLGETRSVLSTLLTYWKACDAERPDQDQVQTTQLQRRQLNPQIPPLLRTCALTRSLASFGSYSSSRLLRKKTEKEKKKSVWCCLLRPKIEEDSLRLVLAHFKENVCRPFLSFVCSFFYLPYCSYKTYRWVDECIVLLLLTCLRLYGLAVSMFGENGGERKKKPWFKKKD